MYLHRDKVQPFNAIIAKGNEGEGLFDNLNRKKRLEKKIAKKETAPYVCKG